MAGLKLGGAGFLARDNPGLCRTHPVMVAALSAGSPVFGAVVAQLLTGTRLGARFWGATALALRGAGIAICGRASAGKPA